MNSQADLRIGVLSDTHGVLHPEIPGFLSEVDEIWHLGDAGVGILEQLDEIAPLRAIHGNADGADVRYRAPASLRFQAAGMDVLMIHDAGLPNSGYKTAVREIITRNGRPDVLACGHTHIARVERDASGLLYLNPGACGQYGPQRVKTILRFTITNSSIKKFEIIELDTRPSVGTDALSVTEFCRRNQKNLTLQDLNAIGRMATRISHERGWPVLKEENPRFGSVNVYLKEALEIACREVMR